MWDLGTPLVKLANLRCNMEVGTGPESTRGNAYCSWRDTAKKRSGISQAVQHGTMGALEDLSFTLAKIGKARVSRGWKFPSRTSL